jgi:hypothetical protein
MLASPSPGAGRRRHRRPRRWWVVNDADENADEAVQPAEVVADGGVADVRSFRAKVDEKEYEQTSRPGRSPVTRWTGSSGCREQRVPRTPKATRALKRSCDDTLAHLAPGHLVDGVNRMNKAIPGTTRTYLQRARSLLEDFASFMVDPKTFKGRGRVMSEKKSDKKETRREAPAPAETVDEEAAARTGAGLVQAGLVRTE